METKNIADTPRPPYYAVIFTSKKSNRLEGYDQTAEKMFKMAAEQDGFLGTEAFSNSHGIGINVSYWRDLDSIKKWKQVPEHAAAQSFGKKKWYNQYKVRICKVERDYDISNV